MTIRNMGLTALAALVLAGGAALALPSPQQSQQPAQSDQTAPTTLADAARRAREQKKEQAKATHTWDNENIPKTPNEINVVGEAPAADPNAGTTAKAAVPSGDASASTASPQGTPAQGAPPAGAAAKAVDKSEVESQLAAAKDLLQSLQKDLDILQRQYTLDQQAFYGKPDYANDTAGAANLKAEAGQMEAKRQQVAEAQAKVDALQAKLGPPPAPAPGAPN